MVRNLPATTPTSPRVIYYIDPVADRAVMHPTAQQLEARRRADQVAYLRWRLRQAQIAERDRKVRRFWLGFGLVTGTGVLAGLGLLVWLVVHTFAVGLLAVPLVLLALAGLTVGGHRCITIVQHWH